MKKIWACILSGMLMGLNIWGDARAAGITTEHGKDLFVTNCVICHGRNGDGNGPGAVAFNPKPGNFTDPKFWQKMNDEKIADTIRTGRGMMPPFNLPPEDIKAIIEYLKHFKK